LRLAICWACVYVCLPDSLHIFYLGLAVGLHGLGWGTVFRAKGCGWDWDWGFWGWRGYIRGCECHGDLLLLLLLLGLCFFFCVFLGKGHVVLNSAYKNTIRIHQPSDPPVTHIFRSWLVLIPLVLCWGLDVCVRVFEMWNRI
jgi:hypothetical protein